MAVKHNNLYLFLALACFVGIILIFIFDGYIGVYDSLVMDNGQFKQTIEGDQWARQEKYGGMVSVGVERGGLVDFTYTIENHRFSEYTADVKITLWYNKAKFSEISFIPDKPTIIPAFDKGELEWSVNTAEMFPSDYPLEQNYIVNVKINMGDIERVVNINIHASSTIIKTVPPGVPVPVITVPAPPQ